GYEAVIWDPVNGLRLLKQALELQMTGGDLGALDYWTLTSATGISADGTVICGYGTNPMGITESFVATFPRYFYANSDRDSTRPVLNASDMLCFINAFAAGQPYANCDGSHYPPVLNINDYLCFIQKFAAGCQ